MHFIQSYFLVPSFFKCVDSLPKTSTQLFHFICIFISLAAARPGLEYLPPYHAYNPQKLSPKRLTLSNLTHLVQESHTQQSGLQKCLETRPFPRSNLHSSLHPSIPPFSLN